MMTRLRGILSDALWLLAIVWLLPFAIMVLGLPLVAIVKVISAVVSAVQSAP